jgi:uncharacterized protein YjbI with pentapeptide repeats
MKILNRFTNSVIFECEANTIKETVEAAVKQGVSLRDANLSGADLRNANLSGADLSGADLRYADLRNANLSGAYLSGADFNGAHFSGANLARANLSGANLRYADLSGADLSGADLRGASLNDANLSGANLSEIKEDYLAVLSVAKHEVVELYKAILSGRINGSTYSGECACLVGTIANIRHEDYRGLGIDLRPSSFRPAERWFTGIKKGDTPENNEVSAIVRDWTLEFMQNNGIV